jgi:predicted secreted protein
MLATGLLPSLVDLAAAAGAWESLRQACRERGDEITFAATLAAAHQQAG